MQYLRAFVILTMLSLASAPVHAGIVDYAKSCWRALVGAEPEPLANREVMVGYRDSAKPKAEERVSTAGVRFVRDDSHPALGEAWCAVDAEGEDLVWGDLVTKADGSAQYMTYDQAMDYCIGLNPAEEQAAIRAALKAGRAPERGIYLPLRSDFARLQRQLGSDAPEAVYNGGAKYQSQVLPNLNYWFWSSSVHPEYSYYAYFFNGRTGFIGYISRDYADDSAVRCVARH
jgi:hypothetical protein